MNIKETAVRMKEKAPFLAASAAGVRNSCLKMIIEGINGKKDEIFAANALDMEEADKAGIPDVVKKRLKYDDNKMRESIAGLEELSELPDPVGVVQLKRELDTGLILTRITVPIGVIGVIFEARPDAMVQVASLCIKSGNCAVLKGGKETANTNRVLFGIIKDAFVKAGLPEECLFQAEDRSEISELLKCDEEIDLLIPRGSNSFVRYIMENTKIPVMGHSSGVCHIFVDKDADLEKAIPLLVDAKKQYAAACNAVETILIHEAVADSFLPVLTKAFEAEGIELRCNDNEFGTEYGDLIANVRIVPGVEEAAAHINHYGSHHTDAILTENDETAAYFLRMVDSAGVYRNCSTRFADGFRYGFGAEVGISTGKLHARGPVGLEGLVTYKYLLDGSGQIVADYAGGKKKFTHVDL